MLLKSNHLFPELGGKSHGNIVTCQTVKYFGLIKLSEIAFNYKNEICDICGCIL